MLYFSLLTALLSSPMSREGTRRMVRDSKSPTQSLLTLREVPKPGNRYDFFPLIGVPEGQQCQKWPTSFYAYLRATGWNRINESTIKKVQSAGFNIESSFCFNAIRAIFYEVCKMTHDP